MKLGIIREGKTPPDKRVPLAPNECKELLSLYPGLEIFVQPSPIRCFTDEEYKNVGISIKEDLSDCDVLMGVKEVKTYDLIAGKKYFFFSHTIKKQPYNKQLLQAILEKNIQMIDYETLTYKNGLRILGFGRYAGIVGAYNGILGFGKKYNLFDLKPANQCKDQAELNLELNKASLGNIKVVLTGGGRVANGAIEILNALNLKRVSKEDFLSKKFIEAVYCQLEPQDYVKKSNGDKVDINEFFKNSEGYESAFIPYTCVADIFISAHFWDPKSPALFTLNDMKADDFNIKVISDITCDINGSVPSTIRPSTITDPFYDFDRFKSEEVPSFSKDTITIMAVDNLPCELPRDASEGFGKDLAKFVLPHLLESDEDTIIERASITKNGELTEPFLYLSDYVAEMS